MFPGHGSPRPEWCGRTLGRGNRSMARTVRRRVRRRRSPAAAGTPRAAPAPEPREQSLPSVLLVGGPKFRAVLALKLAPGERTHILGEVNAELGTFDPVFAPKADVVVARAGDAPPLRSMEIARAIQQRWPGVGVVLVIERVSREHLVEYWSELYNWSLLTPAACSDPAKLLAAVESTAHGIRWVDPELARALEEFEASGGAHMYAERGLEDLPDFRATHGVWDGQTKKAPATGGAIGTWLREPLTPSERRLS